MKKTLLRNMITWLLAALTVFGLCACGRISRAPSPRAEQVPQQAPMPAAVPDPTVVATPVPTLEPTPEPTPEPIVGEVLNDDDGDGIIPYKFNYKGATVYALIVLDPGRVYIGTALPEPSEWGGYGLTLDAMREQ